MKRIISLLILLLATISTASALAITTSNPTTYFHMDINQNVNFNVTADEVVISYSWYKDGTAIVNNWNNLSVNWTTPGQKNLTVVVVSAGGSISKIWHPIIERPKSEATDVTTSLNSSWYDSLLDSMDGATPDFEAFLGALILPFTTSMGNVFYVFLYVMPMVLIWIRQEKALIPAGLGIVFGAFFLGFLPESWRGIMILFMVLTAMGVFYSLFKERG